MNFIKKENNFLKEVLWRSKKSNVTGKKWAILNIKQTLQPLGQTNEKIMAYQVRNFSSAGYPEMRDVGSWESQLHCKQCRQ